jgi:uncharacterized LabA/DUF88 family protein
MEKIVLLIDGSNIWASSRALGIQIDYKKLLTNFKARGVLVRALYFTATRNDGESDTLRPLLDWLDFNGFTMITKPVKEWIDPSTGLRTIKGNMDTEICVELMRYSTLVNHIYLFSGDGDFCYAVKAAQNQGARVSVISTIVSEPPMIANELRRQADEFLDITTLNIQKVADGERARLGHALAS